MASVLVGVVACLYGYRTIVRNYDWAGEEVYWRTATETSPYSGRAKQGYGEALVKMGKFVEARDQFKAAVELDPRSIDLYAALGNAYLLMQTDDVVNGRMEDALTHVKQAYNVLKAGVALERKTVQQNISKENEQRVNLELVGEVHLHIRLGAACYVLASNKVKPYSPKEKLDLLDEGAFNARIAMLNNYHEPTINLTMAQLLMERANYVTDTAKGKSEKEQEKAKAEATAYREDAVAALIKGLLFAKGPKEADAVAGVLRSCYEALGVDPNAYFHSESGYQIDPRLNHKYIVKAFRSMILICRANKADDDVPNLIDRAVLVFQVSRDELKPALDYPLKEQPETMNDPNIIFLQDSRRITPPARRERPTT